MRRSLPWQEPWALTLRLARELGPRGLVLLEGDGSPLGRLAVLGLDPLEVVECRGVPGDPGASDPFAALAAMAASGGSWLGWLAYEAGAWVEPAAHWPAPEMAVLWAARHDPLLRFDGRKRRCWLEGRDAARLAALAEHLIARQQRAAAMQTRGALQGPRHASESDSRPAPPSDPSVANHSARAHSPQSPPHGRIAAAHFRRMYRASAAQAAS